SNVATLVPKWVVHTTDSVTASPTVVGGVVYVGSWDGTFYAVDAATGHVRWTHSIDDGHQVAFGRIVSTAAVPDQRGVDGKTRRIVVFGGGATLYALDAATRRTLAQLDVDPRSAADRAAHPAARPEIETPSSPA